MKYELTYKRYAENAILIEWPAKIDKNTLQDLVIYKEIIKKESVKEIIEIIFTYNSLLIFYKFTIENIYDEFFVLKSLYLKSFMPQERETKLWKIPVCYSPALAPDLEAFAKVKSCTVEEVISLHTTPIYDVYFLGFLPGFCYLGGLDDRLCLPRKNMPSSKVKKGAVAVGGNQTGIYPMDSPGGWHVIGACPLNFFDSNQEVPCFVLPGDNIQFISIKENEYNDISSKVKAGNYLINSTIS